MLTHKKMTNDDKGKPSYKVPGSVWVSSSQTIYDGWNSNVIIIDYIGNRQPSCATEYQLCPLKEY